MKLSHLMFMTFCLLTGCASHLNQESVKKYKDHSLNQFIKDRFTFNNSIHSAVHDGLDAMASSSKNQRSLFGYYAVSKPLPDGSYVFSAPCNGPEILEKPKNELSLFCESKGGRLIAITYYDKDILSLYEMNPMQVYAASVRELSHGRVTASVGGMNVSRPLSDGEINAVAVGEAIRAENTNRYSKIAFARKDYFSALKSGSFGVFNCVNYPKKHVLWSVSIIPIAYDRGDQEHLISDSFYIGIKGKES